MPTVYQVLPPALLELVDAFPMLTHLFYNDAQDAITIRGSALCHLSVLDPSPHQTYCGAAYRVAAPHGLPQVLRQLFL